MSPAVLPGAAGLPVDVRQRIEDVLRAHCYSAREAAQVNAEALALLLPHVTYRDGVRFDVTRPFVPVPPLFVSEAPLLRVFVDTLDSNDRARKVTVGHATPVPQVPFDFDLLVRFVYECVERMEVHEAREWFRVGGAAPYWPHA